MSTLLPSAGTPFLYFAAAALLLWATSRWVSPFGRSAGLALALLPLVFTGPALLTGRVYAPVDLPWTTEPLESRRQEAGLADDEISVSRYDVAFRLIPWRKATRWAIKNGEWPIWNPFMFSGDVLAAAAEPAVYHPIHLLSHLLPLGPSLTFVASLFFLAAATSAFCYAREVGCGESAALLGAAGWAFSSFMLFWMGWPLTLSVAFFPLLMLAARRLARSPGPGAAALLTTASVLIVLAGHPESALHCVAVAIAYGLVEWIADRRRSWATLGWGFAAGLSALALSAVYLLPLIEALPQTREYHLRQGLNTAVRSVPWAVALERLRTLVVPFTYGMPGQVWIRVPGFGAEWPAYAGSVLFPPALYGLWRGRWRGRWLLAGLAAAGLLAYVSAPGLVDLLGRLPLFSRAINGRLVFVVAFALAILAALGADAWYREPPSRRAGWLSLGVLAALALTIAGLWSGMRDLGLPAEFLTTRTLYQLAPLALATVLLLVLRSPPLKVWGLLALLLAQRWVEMAELNPTHPESRFFPPVAELQALPREGTPYRIVGVGLALPPSIATLYELEDARGAASPMTHRRLASTYPLWVGPEKHHRHDARIPELGRPFLRFLNVRFAMVDRGVPVPAPWRPFAEGPGAIVYEDPGALERAFVPRRVRLNEPLGRLRRDMSAETDFADVAWIGEEGHPAPHPHPEGGAGQHANGPGRVTRVERRGLGLRLEVEMEGPGWVVVSQTAWKGWRAKTGGRELPLEIANQAFLAFHLSAGRHQVDLVYRPRSFVAGRAISLGAAGALGLVLVAAWWRRRRATSEVRG